MLPKQEPERHCAKMKNLASQLAILTWVATILLHISMSR
uniref:Uncharacterized protein n=1 Tax=Anguilla anguilla TaxID=7936 RepID=A0A0E9VEC5_ANGAN